MIGIIGGTGLYTLAKGENVEKKTVETPYGISSPISIFKLYDKK